MSGKIYKCFHFEEKGTFDGIKVLRLNKLKTRKCSKCEEDICEYCKSYHYLNCDNLQLIKELNKDIYKVPSHLPSVKTKTSGQNWRCKLTSSRKVKTKKNLSIGVK